MFGHNLYICRWSTEIIRQFIRTVHSCWFIEERNSLHSIRYKRKRKIQKVDIQIMATSTSEQFKYVGTQGSGSRSGWKCWCIAALSLLTFALLFQPWLSATGPAGDLYANAFGRIDGSVPELNTLGYAPANHISISGSWGMLAAIAAVITIFAAILYLIARIEVLSCLMAGAGVATALFVLATVLYLNGKAPELRDMTKHSDAMATGLGSILRKVFGGGEGSNPEAAQQVASAAMKTPALICGLAAVAAAALAIAELRNRIRLTVVDEPSSDSSYLLKPSSREDEFGAPAFNQERAPESSIDPRLGVSLGLLGSAGYTVSDGMEAAARTAANPLPIKIVVAGHHDREMVLHPQWVGELEPHGGVNYDGIQGLRFRRRGVELVLANVNDVR
ncbi:hypothetical protein [Nocardia sp. NBC_00403]|uniref:hypothetical protein n=1 Tax=Nocardia sp. NBC_00403 TaxID=2975990 RepID=UPI002E221B48